MIITLNNNDTSKLKKAFIDAAILSAEKAISQEAEPVMPRSQHTDILSTYLEKAKKKSRKMKPKKMLIIIVAVLVITLTSCAALFQTIKGFIITVFHNHDRIELVNENTERQLVITDLSLLQIQLDNYHVVESQQSSYQILISLRNQEGNTITIIQSTTDQGAHRVDNEQSIRITIELSECQIICYKFSETNYNYIWNAEYSYLIESSTELSNEFLEKICSQIK